MAHYLVCYDIADPKRLAKVHRRAVSHAAFVQYSIYYLKGSQDDLENMLTDIREVINESLDDVRAYSVTPLSEAIQKGVAWLPEDFLML